MYSLRGVFFVFAIVLGLSVEFGDTIISSTTNAEWEAYKQLYNKNYANAAISESYARYYYNYNKKLIDRHNTYYDRGSRSYRLKVNQFTDMRLVHFNALFPQTVQPITTSAAPPPPVAVAPPSFDPRTDLALTINVENQGTDCNGGWAYAAAKAIELMASIQTGNTNPARLSAQNLIDCAGGGRGCRNQVPSAAFEYLTLYNQDLHLESDYPNNNALAQQGMCITPPNAMIVTNLARFSRINDGDDESMKRYVGAGLPVVIEFNPTSFEFMHYGSDIFTQPSGLKRGSHYMVVVGYGTDTRKNQDYWLVLNSFGTTWGENGYIRIARNAARPLAKSAFFPTELAG